jgi:hypothetical protein
LSTSIAEAERKNDAGLMAALVHEKLAIEKTLRE